MCLPFRSSSSAAGRDDDDSSPDQLPTKKYTGRRTPEATARIEKSHFRNASRISGPNNPSDPAAIGGHVAPSSSGYGGADSGHGGAYGGLYGGVQGGVYNGVSGGTTGGVYGGVNAGVYGTSHGGGDRGGYLS